MRLRATLLVFHQPSATTARVFAVNYGCRMLPELKIIPDVVKGTEDLHSRERRSIERSLDSAPSVCVLSTGSAVTTSGVSFVDMGQQQLNDG